MRHLIYALCLMSVLAFSPACSAKAAKSTTAPADSSATGTPLTAGAPSTGPGNGHIEVTADQSLEWYQDQRIYVARGNAKAIRGDMTVEADILTAHERDLPPKAVSAAAETTTGSAAAATTTGNAMTVTTSALPTAPAPETAATEKPAKQPANDNGTGDIDKMTAEGNVRVTTSKAHITGEHGVYDLNQHVAYLTGDNLSYKTETETVTSKDSLEYWEDKKVAVARGHAVAVGNDRHVEGDVLTAQFRDMPNGKSQMHTLTSDGNVLVITSNNDVTRGNRAVYDINRNIAVVTGNVRITRADGTQLTGDVAEVDFATNQSRLMNEGHGRVRALLTSKATPKGANSGTKQQAAVAQ